MSWQKRVESENKKGWRSLQAEPHGTDDELSEISPSPKLMFQNTEAMNAIKNCDNPSALAEEVSRNNKPELLVGVSEEEIALWKELLVPQKLHDIYENADYSGRKIIRRAISYSPDLDLRSVIVSSSNRPNFIVLGGASASGKSNLAKKLQGISTQHNPPPSEQIAQDTLRITPDDIISALEQDGIKLTGDARHKEKLPENIEKYYKKLGEVVDKYLRQGKSVTVDDHCDDLPTIEKLLANAKNISPPPRTFLIGVTAEEESINTFLRRSKLLGHNDIPTQAIDYIFAVRTAENFRKNFKRFCGIFDVSILYQTSIEDEKNLVVGSWVNNGNQVAENIIVEDAWEAFLNGRNIPPADIANHEIAARSRL